MVNLECQLPVISSTDLQEGFGDMKERVNIDLKRVTREVVSDSSIDSSNKSMK